MGQNNVYFLLIRVHFTAFLITILVTGTAFVLSAAFSEAPAAHFGGTRRVLQGYQKRVLAHAMGLEYMRSVKGTRSVLGEYPQCVWRVIAMCFGGSALRVSRGKEEWEGPLQHVSKISVYFQECSQCVFEGSLQRASVDPACFRVILTKVLEQVSRKRHIRF